MFGFDRLVQMSLVLTLVVGAGCGPEEGAFPCDCDTANAPPITTPSPPLPAADAPVIPAVEENGSPVSEPPITPDEAPPAEDEAMPTEAAAPSEEASEMTPVSPTVDPADETNLVAPIRILVLQSETVPALDASLTDVEIRDRFAQVNDIWAVAGIRFEVESIRRQPALNAEAYAALMEDGATRAGRVLGQLYAPADLLQDGWNAVLIEDFGAMPPGVYSCNSGVLVAARFFGRQHREAPANVLAHELGHALGLPHLCGQGENLMCANGMSPRALFDDQIEVAREHVRRGSPAQCAP